jgi:hypothetical protein
MDESLQRGLMTAIGMSIAYLASGLGMLFAYLGYQKQRHEAASDRRREEADDE